MNSMAHSIGLAFGAQIKAVADAQSVGWRDNPALPVDVGTDKALLFVLSRGDRLQDQPGQQPERRRLRLIVGAVSTTEGERAHADALHFAARDRLKSLALRQALKDAGCDAQDVREVELEPELREIATRGAVLMSAYEIDYFQSYPSFA